MFVFSSAGIAQPAIKKHCSTCSTTYWTQLKALKHNWFRNDIIGKETGIIEVMCPMFRIDVWLTIREFLDETRTTDWGPDVWWCAATEYLLVKKDDEYVVFLMTFREKWTNRNHGYVSHRSKRFKNENFCSKKLFLASFFQNSFSKTKL